MNKKNFYLLTFMMLHFYLGISPSHAIDWSLAYGAHDFLVQDALPDGDDSHTLGVGIEIYGEHTTESGIEMMGSYLISLDRDKDDLDPDHIPIWFMFNFETLGNIHNFAEHLELNWYFDVDAKRNTVSSVEKQFKTFPGIGISYDIDKFAVGAKANVGYYYLEIDDDVAKTRGYSRGDYVNKTSAYSIMANSRISFADAFDFNAVAQTWVDKDLWLEQRYEISLSYDSNDWITDSVFKISIVHTKYNHDHYALIDTADPSYVPILPWDTDTLMRAYIIIPWD